MIMFYIVIQKYKRCPSLTSFEAGLSFKHDIDELKLILFYTGLNMSVFVYNFRYHNLIKKAVKEGIVVERNTLSDFFLQPKNECKANFSAACLPYCENDFWPGEAERLLEKDDNTKQKKKAQVGRLLRVAKRYDRKGNPKDIFLVHKVRSFYFIFFLSCLPAFRAKTIVLFFNVASLAKGCATWMKISLCFVCNSCASTVTSLSYLAKVGFALAVKISIFVLSKDFF
jgi:hypothetical protein